MNTSTPEVSHQPADPVCQPAMQSKSPLAADSASVSAPKGNIANQTGPASGSKLNASLEPDSTSEFTMKQTVAMPTCPVQVRNLESNRLLNDKLFKAFKTGVCPMSHCNAAIMEQSMADEHRSAQQVIQQAEEFLREYFKQLKGATDAELSARIEQVKREFAEIDTINYTFDELSFAARTAWRNASRCIGRIQWNRLQMFDFRHVTSTKQMFEAICNHIRCATNEGNIKSTITVFPARKQGREDFRLWNSQLISYAGYQLEDGSVMGDPINMEFTKICLRHGWNKPKSERTRFDILPIILSAPNEKPTLYEIPEELVLRVPIEHPTYEAVAALDLQWYALPAVSAMQFDAGGLQFTAAPFNGWYMSSEIGVRDMLDQNRYNLLNTLAEAFGFDTKAPAWQWKDKVAVELNVAILHSYNKKGVTLVDQHSASDQFIQHMQNEYQNRGGCPADWVWIVPPISGSLTKVFHQEMINYKLKPSFEYQDKAWRTYKFESNIKLKTHFRSAVFALRWILHCNNQMLTKRPKIRVLFATETGKSKEFAQRFVGSMERMVHIEAIQMNEYDLQQLQQETHLIIVCSTFGSGEPPENGETFSKHLDELVEKGQKLTQLNYSVLALGSSQYEYFAGFGKSVDARLKQLGAHPIIPIQCADELKGQEDVYDNWSTGTRNTICEQMGVDKLQNEPECDYVHQFKLVSIEDDKSEQAPSSKEINCMLSKVHQKSLYQCDTKEICRLQPPCYPRQTVLAQFEIDPQQMKYLPGDHLGVFPANDQNVVTKFLSKLYVNQNTAQSLSHHQFDTVQNTDSQSTGIRPEVIEMWQHLRTLPESLINSHQKVQLKKLSTSNGWIDTDRLPAASLNTLFTHFIDLWAAPSVRLLSQLIPFVANVKESQRMQQLVQCKQAYAEWRLFDKPSIIDLFTHFPSLRIPVEFLLMNLSIIQARFYSISSSLDNTENEVHLTVSVADHITREGKGEKRTGLCSGFLSNLNPNTPINCFVRSAPTFRLPADPMEPIILICAGSGIAPFRSFWMQRQHDLSTGKLSLSKMFLFFGCRQSKLDVLFGTELPELLNERVLHDVFYAYSRDQQHKKRYVQDQVYKQRGLLLWLIEQEQGHVYVCGSAAMANGVRNTFLSILQSEQGLDQEQAEKRLHTWLESGHYHEDVFTSLHSTDITLTH